MIKNNNDNNNYILYKKIFNNKILSNLIFEYIYEINKNIINKKNENITEYIDKNHKYFLKDVPFEIILSNNNYALFLDRIKSKTKIDFKLSLITLCYFLKKNNASESEIREFYFLNKDILISDYKYSNRDNKNIFEILIETNMVSFLKIVYQDQKMLLDNEKDIYYLKKNKNLKKDEESGECGNNNKLKFSLYTNDKIVQNSIYYSSLEIIKYLKDVIEIDFDKHNDQIFYWVLLSDNRRHLLQYFLNELNFKIPTVFENSSVKIKDLFNPLLLLEYNMYKQIYKSGLPIFTNSFKDYIYTEKIQEKRNKGMSFNLQLDFILSSIHLNFKLSKSIVLKVLIKIIKQLIIYNDNPIQDNIVNLNYIKSTVNHYKEKKRLVVQKTFKLKFKNNNDNQVIVEREDTFLNKFVLPFIPTPDFHTLKDLQKDNYKIESLDKFTEIKYDNFNLEREVKRIYIFEFLNRKSLMNEIGQLKDLLTTIIYFATKYQEYEIINILLKEFINDSNKLIIIEEVYNNIFAYGDIELYYFTKDHEIKLNQISFPNFTDFHIRLYEMNIEYFEKYYQLLSLFSKHHENNLFSKLFFSLQIFLNSDIQQFERLLNILKQFYIGKKVFQKLRAQNLIEQSFAIHCFKYYKEYFLDWDSNDFIRFKYMK